MPSDELIIPGLIRVGKYTWITWAVLCIRKALSESIPNSSLTTSSAIPIPLVIGEYMRYSLRYNTWLMRAYSSKLSFRCADEARSAVLSHFKASASEYTVIFTANASAAMKLVAESYQFREGSKLVIGADSHNSVCFHFYLRPTWSKC